MKQIKNNYKIYLLFLPIVLVILDQVTKHLVRQSLVNPPKKVELIPGVLCFQYLENRGAVWGLFQGKYDLLSIISIGILILFIYLMVRIPRGRRYVVMYFVMLFIVAGAIGNLIDRIVFGFVTDFIYFELINFPIFNVADIYVTVAIFVLLYLVCFFHTDDELSFLPFFGTDKKDNTKDESK